MSDVEQARAWFRENPTTLDILGDSAMGVYRHAATIVRYDLAAGDDALSRLAESLGTAVREENVRLRARAEAAERRVEELETAGDELADEVQRLGDTPIEWENWNAAANAIEAWRAMRGER